MPSDQCPQSGRFLPVSFSSQCRDSSLSAFGICRGARERLNGGRYRLVRFQPKKHGSRLTAPNDRRAMREGLIIGWKADIFP